jgi:signal transduction histidine kinase
MATSLGRFLREQRQPLLDRWSKRVEELLDDPQLTKAELRDHMPELMKGLASVVSPEETPEDAVTEPGVKHGQQRFRVGFDLREVVTEYGLLLDVILEGAHAAGIATTPVELRDLIGAVNVGVAEAVTAFSDERREVERKLAAEHVSFVSHELRNPLGAALLSLELLESTSLDERQTRLGGMVRRNLTRLRDLVHQVLTAERLRAGVAPCFERCSLESILAEATEESVLSAQSRDVDLQVDRSPDIEVTADPRLLKSIVSNLVQNAVKFSKPGGVVRVSARRENGRAVLEVADSCGGIEGPVEDFFRPFVQGANEQSGRGFGLGLAIVVQAVEAHGGEIQVRNTDGEGCVFTVSLPLGPGADAV